ncbi:hypothetical protein [Enterococcus sp. AZ103]|uniref:hypothetical protein n=1 Tax=Enterococcus sp. AZ103 TaxID=2774628 RepID=UPI003F209F09
MKKIVLGSLVTIFSLACFGSQVFAADEGIQKMFRVYNPNSGEHFYTANNNEKIGLISAGWKDEGVGWNAPKKSKNAVFRVYNPNSGDHHYTTSRDESNNLVKNGWKDEGVGWYSSEIRTYPIYRSYNSNAKAGSHHYSAYQNEIQSLVSKGWKNEGVGWYSLKQGDWEYGTKEIWVPNIVTVIDQPEYTTNDWAYTLYTFPDGKQFKSYHQIGTTEGDAEQQAITDYADKLDSEGKLNNVATRDVYKNVTHPAITHTEDRGSYQIVIDESNIIWK